MYHIHMKGSIMKNKIMNKKIVRDIAIALIAKSAERFDLIALDETDISENEKENIILEKQYQCFKMISKIESKYNIHLKDTTSEIVEQLSSFNS